MRKDVTASQKIALSANTCIGVWFVHLDIEDDPVSVWTGTGEISWDSKTWIGIGGEVGQISKLQSDAKGNIPGAEVSLVGIDGALLASVKSQKYAGRKAHIYCAILDQDDFSLIDDPFLMFAGEISDMTILSGKENKITVSIESRLQVLRRTRPRYRTDEDQQREFPGDKFFEYVPKLAGKTIYWGMKSAKTIGYGGSAGGGRFDQDAIHFKRH